MQYCMDEHDTATCHHELSPQRCMLTDIAALPGPVSDMAASWKRGTSGSLASRSTCRDRKQHPWLTTDQQAAQVSCYGGLPYLHDHWQLYI